MIWRIEHLPHGRVRGTCKTCGYPTLHPNLRTAELWARRHDVVTCVMTKQTRDAAQRTKKEVTHGGNEAELSPAC